MSDLRDDLMAVTEELAAPDEGSPEPIETPAADPGTDTIDAAPEGDKPDRSPSESHEGRARDEHGRFSKTSKKADPGTPSPDVSRAKADGAEVPPGSPAPSAQPVVDPAAPPVPPADAPKAPQAFRPIAREDWAKVPPTVQQEITRREKEIAVQMQESADLRRNYQQIQEAVKPFEAMMQASGYTPARALQEYGQMSYIMNQGSPQQRAQLIAHMINASGADVDHVNQFLSGQAPQGQPQQQQPANMEAQLEALLQRKIQAATEMRRQQELQQFAQNHEFFDDVRDDIDLIVERERRRGLSIPLEAAYTKAIALHPEISKVMAQREAAKAAANANASTQRARNAASTVRSSPAAQVDDGAQPESIRDYLIEAAKEARRR